MESGFEAKTLETSHENAAERLQELTEDVHAAYNAFKTMIEQRQDLKTRQESFLPIIDSLVQKYQSNQALVSIVSEANSRGLTERLDQILQYAENPSKLSEFDFERDADVHATDHLKVDLADLSDLANEVVGGPKFAENKARYEEALNQFMANKDPERLELLVNNAGRQDEMLEELRYRFLEHYKVIMRQTNEQA